MRTLCFAFVIVCFSGIVSAAPKNAFVQMATESKSAPAVCERYRADVLHEIENFSDVPAWRIIVTCDETMWRYLRQHNNANHTETAFSNPKAADGRALTVLRGGAWDSGASLHETLEHELKHIRCNCSLGE